LLLHLYIAVSNVFNFQIIYSHGINQYVENIVSFDVVPVVKVAKKTQAIYLDRDISNGIKYKKTLKKNINFKYLGTIEKEKITWVSVQVIDGRSIVNGFLLAEGELTKGFFDGDTENIYYRNVSELSYDKKLKNLKNKFKKEILRNFKIKKETNKIIMQESINNKDYFIISELSSDVVLYFTDKDNEKEINDIYNNYLGDNLDAWVIQLDKDYSLKKYGPYERDVVYDTLGNNYIKIIFLLVTLFLIFSKKKVKIKCQYCNSNKITIVNTEKKFLRYLYQNKDGSPDGRKKNVNKKVFEIKNAYNCNKCNGNFFLFHELNYSI